MSSCTRSGHYVFAAARMWEAAPLLSSSWVSTTSQFAGAAAGTSTAYSGRKDGLHGPMSKGGP